ncbi:MAG: hypothetical protein ACR2MY_09040 [Candidatus Dormibacteria bacterium]
MSQKIARLRKATERPIRIAKMAAVGTVAVIVVGGTLLIVLRARKRAEERTILSRARAVAKAAGDPQKTYRKARKETEKSIEEGKEKLRDELRKQLADQVKDTRPLHEKILTGAASSAASAAIPIVMRKIQERMETAPAASKGKG